MSLYEIPTKLYILFLWNKIGTNGTLIFKYNMGTNILFENNAKQRNNLFC